MKVKIIIKNLQKKIPVTTLTETSIKRAILRTCSSEAIKKPGEITVCLVNNSLIKELNLNYLAQYNPTDVIAFDFAEKNRILADIVVSTDTAITNARRFKTSLSYELLLYVVHGMLHVLGYDDYEEGKRKLMDKKAEAILEKICP
ncbi:MAG: rRNA maturation RNase YbeY [Candidatus Omnitrophica bacterium]|nr:rRNA maturation RNase YbeY [Candidatus Omnitrophota bacterium]